MPHKITWEKNGFYRHFSGHVTGDEIMESNEQIHKHPNFLDTSYTIDDFTNVENHSVEAHHIDAYALSDKIVSLTKGHLKVALVINQQDHMPLAKYYKSLMDGEAYNCQIFSTLEQARAWVEE